MATIVEPASESYSPEHRGLFQPETEAHTGVIVQGGLSTWNLLKGNEDDDEAEVYEVRLLVGPFWRNVENVVPQVTIGGYNSSNPDEDDRMRWIVGGVRWDTVGEQGPSQDELRIRLKASVVVQGEHAEIISLGYFLMASGRLLGAGGINAPGPVHPQG